MKDVLELHTLMVWVREDRILFDRFLDSGIKRLAEYCAANRQELTDYILAQLDQPT